MELDTKRCWEVGHNGPAETASVDIRSIKGNIHFVGIGGIGMSALARLLLAEKSQVSGSDKEANAITDELKALGATIHIGHEAKNVEGAGALVVSTAITDTNPELKAAQAKSLPILHRSQVLAQLAQNQKLIAVSGTHGKTTTTGMVAQVFLEADTEPTVVVGGVFPRIQSNAVFGKGKFFIAEADESDRTHSNMRSHIAIVTNIEADHLENYPGGINQIYDTMLSFANGSDITVICVEDEGCLKILPKLTNKVITYGVRQGAKKPNYSYETVNGSCMRVYRDEQKLGDITLSVPGEHNKLNALSAVAVAMEAGLPFETAASALTGFGGVARRFQILGTKGGVLVIDDYGHHPTEVRATLEAAQQYKAANSGTVKRVVACFQPHQPGRLRDLWNEFVEAFGDADLVLLTDIYVARGGPIEGISSERFAGEMKAKEIRYLPGPTNSLPEQIVKHVQSGDMVLTIGAGDITKVGGELLKLLK